MIPAVFIIIALLELVSISMLFIFKYLLHNVLALAMAFFFNSLLFLMLNQILLALLQLFIMVGGISTYLFVGVASVSYSHFKHTNYIALVALSVVFFAVLLYSSLTVDFPTQQQNSLSNSLIGGYLSSSVPLLYMLAFALFGVALGSIVLLKKVGAIK